ncbi:MAG TPA: hypothetical protein VHC22_09885 [Pirellulales bacterium]|nr:hypothetical protein [Pirellulales bacterium]
MRLTMVVVTSVVLALGGAFMWLHQRAIAAERQEQLLLAQAGSAVEAIPAATPPQALPGVRIQAMPPGGFGGAPVAPTPGTGNLFAQPSVHAPESHAWPAGDAETDELLRQDQQLEQEVQTLAHQLADSNDDKQRAELKDKLSQTLDKQFDTQQKLRELEVSRIEARVQRLRELIRKRTDSRRKIIDNRFEQLLNDADGLGWTSGAKAGPQYWRPSITPAPFAPAGGNVPVYAPTSTTPKPN